MEVELHSNVHQIKSSSTNKTPAIWCVGAGKGGVGKSFVSSSLAICLSKLGNSVTLVDLDVGGANLHTCLGAQPKAISLRNFLDGSCPNIESLISLTDIPNVFIIPGFWDAWGSLELPDHERQRIKNALRNLKSDYVILDLGAGAHEMNLDFMKFADQRVIITSPEPSSIENCYRYLEAYMYHVLNEHCSPQQVRTIVDTVRNYRTNKQMAFFSFNQMLKTIDPIMAEKLMKVLRDNSVKLIMNQTRTHSDIELGKSIQTVSQKYFGVYLENIGSLNYDNAVWQSLRKRKPPLLDNPFSWLVGQYLSITKHLVGPQNIKAVV